MTSYNKYNNEMAAIYESIALHRVPAQKTPKSALFESITGKQNEIQIFLSHKSVDKPKVKLIADYLESRSVPYYLDSDDPHLQKAFRDGDDVLITYFIEAAIKLSSHIMPCLSESTKQSWWVPYEIGFGKSSKKEIATVFLKDVQLIPEYLKVTKQISTKADLEKYIDDVARDNAHLMVDARLRTLDGCRKESGRRLWKSLNHHTQSEPYVHEEDTPCHPIRSS